LSHSSLWQHQYLVVLIDNLGTIPISPFPHPLPPSLSLIPLLSFVGDRVQGGLELAM
jgi:hypothetical protein